MKKLIGFILYGLLFTSVPEFTNLIVINKSPEAFIGTAVMNTVFLATGFLVQEGLSRLLSNMKVLVGLYVTIFGTLGLMFEWVFVGHGPGSGAIQLGMFVYWTGLFLIPMILTDLSVEVAQLRRKTLKVFLGYLLFHLALTLAVAEVHLPAVIPILWTIVYSLFFVFYFKYATLKESAT